MKLLVDIPPDLNKKLKFHKIEYDMVNLQDALLDVLSKFFKKTKNDRSN